MARSAAIFSFALFLLTSSILPVHAAAPVPIESVFNARTFNCTAQDDSLIFKLYMVTYQDQTNKNIQKAGDNQVKLGNIVLSGVSSFTNTAKQMPYYLQNLKEFRSLQFNVEKDGIKIVRLAFVEGPDWAGYSFDITGTDDKVQNFFDKYRLNKAEHPIEEIHTTREGNWRITCNVSGA